MRTLLLLLVVGVVAVGAYNYSQGRNLFSLPGTSAGALKDTVRETVKGTVRDTAQSAARGASATAREAKAEVEERAAAGVHAAVNRTEEVASSAALTSKIKAKMALDDLVKAADIDVDTDGGVVTLTGTVGSKNEQRRAVRIAAETKGVTKVVSHLRVR